MQTVGFDDLIQERTGADFVERKWLTAELSRHAKQERYTLIIGEPGAGKTTLLAGLARDNPDWLRYFVRRDSITSLVGSDLTTFLLAVGHQLARSRPTLFEPQKLEVVVQQKIGLAAPGSSVVGIRIDDLVASPFHRTARLTVEQHVTRLEGDVTGIEVGRAYIEPRLLEPATLAELALYAPAAVLTQDDPEARIVIVIDALDELARDSTGGLLDWLIRGPELPANVRVLMAARPSTGLGGLRSARRGIAEVIIDPSAPDVRRDLDAYARRNLLTTEVGEAVRAQRVDLEDFLHRVVNRSAGNFLYLSAYTRALTDVAGAGKDGELAAALISFLDIPEGLRGLYTFFLDTIRRDVGQLGQVELTGGSWAAPWEAVGQSVLGILTVAQAAVSPDDIRRLSMVPATARVIGNVLGRMRWILNGRDGSYSFFHASVAEFLTTIEARDDHPEWAVEEREWHARIVQSCKRGRAEWSDVDWAAAPDYDLLYVAAHMIRAGEGHQVPALVRRPVRVELRSRFGNDRYFVDITDLALDQAIRGTDLSTALPVVLYLSIVARQLRRGGRKLSPAVLGLCARMGRTDEALEHVLAIGASEQRVEAMAQVIDRAAVTDDRRRRLVELLVESAIMLDGVPGNGFSTAMSAAAVRVARYDAPRALQLAQRGGADPDPVYAAAAAADPGRALEFLARMGEGRTTACLDLAEKARGTDAIALVQLAETGLASIDIDRRLMERARLAQLDHGRRPEHLRLLEAECALLDPSNSYPHAMAMIDAASRLSGIAHDLARSLLRSVSRPSPKKAQAWIALGEPSKARQVLDECLRAPNDSSQRLAAAEVLAALDPKAGQRLIDEVLAEAESMAPPGDLISQLNQEGLIERLASILAPTNPVRAEALARKVTRTSWEPIGLDRATLLATLAEQYLDAGNTDLATRLLIELLADATHLDPLQIPEVGGPSVRAGQPVSGGQGSIMHLVYWTNVQNQWAARLHRRLFIDPADVARAYAPGPTSVDSPYGWARTLRVLATRLSGPEFPAAKQLAQLIVDPCERVVVQGELFTAAITNGLRDQEAECWRGFQESLADLPAWEWALDRASDGGFGAYLRPDLRARFDAAISILPYEADPGMDIVAGLDALTYLFQMSFARYASDTYLRQLIDRRRPQEELRSMHESLASSPAGSMSDPLIESMVRVTVARNERLISGRELEISDPVYRLLERTTPDPLGLQMPPDPALEIDPERRPALAGVVLLNRENPVMGDFATRLYNAATAAADYETLVILARAGYGDPRTLIGDLLPRLEGMFFVDSDDLLPDLAVLLFRHAPDEALRFLSRAVESRWKTAAAIIEYAADDILDLAGPDIGLKLNAAVFAAFGCCAVDDAKVPDVIDGVTGSLPDHGQ
jgi:hypothetical protein